MGYKVLKIIIIFVKVKTTVPARYQVKPSIGIINPGSVVNVELTTTQPFVNNNLNNSEGWWNRNQGQISNISNLSQWEWSIIFQLSIYHQPQMDLANMWKIID